MILSTFVNLVFGHFIADYPLQGDNLALGKNKNIDKARYGVPWYYWMLAHACTHGMVVSLITHNVFYGIIEVVAHFIIDYIKCEKIINLHVDQFLHIFLKFLYCL